MRKKIKAFSALMLPLLSSFSFAAPSTHLDRLKSKFPYGLLGDDYGILTSGDLAFNACNARPVPFDPTSDAYQYWQCFEARTITFECDSSGVPDEHEGVMGLIVVTASTDHSRHEYIEHRPWPIRECKSFIKDAAALLKGTRYACISGSFIGSESDPHGYPSMNWMFERIKTRKGCEGRGCDFTRAFKRDHCSNLNY